MKIQLKRAYEDASPEDGQRILVDRLWPRGLSKERAKVDFWAKDIAPSNELRKWYGHDPDRWNAFKARYFRELDSVPEEIRALRDRIDDETVTFVYSAKDEAYNNAVALKQYLMERQPDDR